MCRQLITDYPDIVPIKIDTVKTLFWRFQSTSDTYLATIEAIYWAVSGLGIKVLAQINE